MKKYLFITITYVIISSCGNNRTKMANQYMQEYETLVKQKVSMIENQNQNLHIADQIVYWGTDSLQTLHLHELISDSTLFFYFSVNTCQPCLDETVEIFNEIYGDYKEVPYLIFVSPDYPKRFWNNCMGKRLLNLENKQFDIHIDEDDFAPICFTLNKNMKIETFHVVNKMDMKRTRKYLMKDRFAAKR
jgi:hypothetical protein